MAYEQNIAGYGDLPRTLEDDEGNTVVYGLRDSQQGTEVVMAKLGEGGLEPLDPERVPQLEREVEEQQGVKDVCGTRTPRYFPEEIG